MISEPELEGEWTSERPAEAARLLEVEDGAGPKGPRRAWWWALGGAVVASAVWAGVLAVQDRFADGPPLAYRHTEDLCQDAELKALSGFAGNLDRGPKRQGRSPALDWSFCSFSSGWEDERTSYFGHVLVELHKRTDPETEFGAGPALDARTATDPTDAQEVPGLGERALLFRHVMAPRIQVLAGGAVFTIALEWHTAGTDVAPDSEPDEDALAAALIEDARALMSRLKK
ncbi:hypothetical protein ACWGHM_11365 [Streptomyces sp. NPDC054904]|uniref:hypothetical protein n=1 Tax=Streptomyces sp. NPDC090054 TaxID=3365933 RepID=UPI0038206325